MIVSGGEVTAARASFENPSISLSDASLINMIGGDVQTAAGPVVSEASALSTMIAAYRAVALISGLVAGSPLRSYRYAGRKELFPRCLATPGYDRTPFELWETVTAHLCGWGNAWVFKERDAFGVIQNLVPLMPSRVHPRYFRPGELVPEGVKVFEVDQPDGTKLPLTNFELMHIPGLSYDGLLGLSPIAVARQALGTQRAADDLAARMFSSGNMIGGILHTDRSLTQAQADAVKARWREKMQGSKHAHDIAVLDAGLDFTPTTLAPEEAQFLQTRRWQVIEVARVYGIPPHLLGDVERTTSWGTGIEQQNIGFVAYTIRSYTNRIQQRVSQQVVTPSTQFSEFDLDHLLRGSMLERSQAYASAIQWGWQTRNEVRGKENLIPLDGLDEPLTPLNMVAGKNDVQGELAPASADAQLEAEQQQAA